ncbi:MAG: uroporphyrinogen decarboxylase family protein [Planctomycetota bacterium]|nr:uroporphyrinogen decarboxylase family protein [Planctomycetota bacterium]
MNSYDRYMGMVKGRKVDIVPRIPILMHFAARHINASYADFAGDYRVMFEANKALVLDFGFDQLDIMSDPYRETSAFGGQITYLQTTVPRCTAPLADTKCLKTLAKPDPLRSPRMKNSIDCIREYKKFGCRKYSITGWVEGPIAEAADLRGVETFLLDLIDDEPFACELMDICVETAVDYAKAQIDHGCDTIGIGDAIASQISSSMYEQIVFPREKKLVDAIHRNGSLVRVHICGNIMHLLPVMAGLGADIIDCDWQVDMKQARRILGPKAVLAGNLDPVNAVMKSTPEKIRQDLKAVYEIVGNPYFVGAGCEIPPDTPVENLMALCRPIEAK